MSDFLDLESGDSILQESGDELLLERITAAAAGACNLALESGFSLLLESGDNIILEGCDVEVVIEPTGGGYGARVDGVARMARLRTIIRSDDELMAVL